MITLNEIFEQSEKLNTVGKNYYEISKKIYDYILEKKPEQINFQGCGTSYYLAMAISLHMNRIAERHISNYYSGSEIMFGLVELPPDSLLVGLSRSGESSETVGALEAAGKKGVATASITCEPGSSMTKKSDVSAEMDFINEKSIVMTKSFTSMGFLTSCLMRQLFEEEKLNDYIEEITKCSANILDKTKKVLSEIDFGKYDHFVFLGYEEYFATGMEGVIKATETSLSDVDCYQTLEYRHGPKSKVSEKSLITVIPNEKTLEEELRVMNEMRKLGGTVLAVYKEKIENFPTIVTGYKGDDFGDWFLRVIPLQMIGVKRAVERGLNPDQPTNLTKVVKF